MSDDRLDDHGDPVKRCERCGREVYYGSRCPDVKCAESRVRELQAENRRLRTRYKSLRERVSSDAVVTHDLAVERDTAREQVREQGEVIKRADVDRLAQEIRRVDGGHNMGAGALAEAIRAYLLGLPNQEEFSELEDRRDLERGPVNK